MKGKIESRSEQELLQEIADHAIASECAATALHKRRNDIEDSNQILLRGILTLLNKISLQLELADLRERGSWTELHRAIDDWRKCS
jgi:hypothetical protein